MIHKHLGELRAKTDVHRLLCLLLMHICLTICLQWTVRSGVVFCTQKETDYESKVTGSSIKTLIKRRQVHQWAYLLFIYFLKHFRDVIHTSSWRDRSWACWKLQLSKQRCICEIRLLFSILTHNFFQAPMLLSNLTELRRLTDPNLPPDTNLSALNKTGQTSSCTLLSLYQHLWNLSPTSILNNIAL